MQDTIIQLKALGQMPDSLTGNPAGELVSKYDELLIKVKTPLTEEEVEALIGIFPESTMYEVEWTLLDLVETYLKPELLSKYRNLISKCPSEEWRDTMKVRSDNWEKKMVVIFNTTPSHLSGRQGRRAWNYPYKND